MSDDQVMSEALRCIGDLRSMELDLKDMHRWGKVDPHGILNTLTTIVGSRTFIEEDIKTQKCRPEVWEDMFVIAQRAFKRKALRISYPN